MAASGALGGAASGAAMGTQIMPGWGTAIGAVAGGVLGAASGGSGGGSSPAISNPINEIGIDFSNWTVSTHGSKAEGGTTGLDIPPWLILGGAVLVAVVAVRWIVKKS